MMVPHFFPGIPLKQQKKKDKNMPIYVGYDIQAAKTVSSSQFMADGKMV